jgi:hypothetical protein
VPDQHSARSEDARKLGKYTPVITRRVEEAERGKEIHDCIEPPRPARRQAPHVAAPIPQHTIPDQSPVGSLGYGEEISRVVESVQQPASLGEQPRVASLPTGTIEHPSSRWEIRQELDDTAGFCAVASRGEQRLVLAQVVTIKVRGPPGRAGTATNGQKNTGSRYAPNTLSSAARISYNVQ